MFRFKQEAKEGAAMVEACLVMIMLCLILFGFLQLSHVIMSGNVLRYTAFATARAASVGLNPEMQERVSLYASIPTAGANANPTTGSGNLFDNHSIGEQMDYAVSRKNTPIDYPGSYEVFVKEAFHTAADNEYRTVLNFENWETGRTRVQGSTQSSGGVITSTLQQDLPLTFPFASVFTGHLGNSVVLNGRTYPAFEMRFSASLEDHGAYYLQN
ncbi:pilus assembly protein [Pontiellaceae bacterium B12219]|nr:pilus assembly protein [Pontiellaceae bacterium B12219]